jgi:hypothetical protein
MRASIRAAAVEFMRLQNEISLILRRQDRQHPAG